MGQKLSKLVAERTIHSFFPLVTNHTKFAYKNISLEIFIKMNFCFV